MCSRMEISDGCIVRYSENRKIEINSCLKILTSTVVKAEAGVAHDAAEQREMVTTKAEIESVGECAPCTRQTSPLMRANAK